MDLIKRFAAEVYDFTLPPGLGGKMEPANVRKMDFVVALNLGGQLHDQIRHLPPGRRSRE